MSAPDETPSPVRAVRQFEADEEAAKKLQQLYDDENQAAETQEQIDTDAEFDRVTRAQDDAKSAKLAERLQD